MSGAEGSGPLPNGWRWARLGEVATVNPRRVSRARADDALTTFVPMQAIDGIAGVIAAPETRTYAEIKKGFTAFQCGDVLFAKITPCMQNGKHAIASALIDGVGFGSTEFHVVRPSEHVLASWVHRFLRQPAVLRTARDALTGAVGQQRVPPEFLRALVIAVPPLPEQRRIADLLNAAATSQASARAAATTSEASLAQLGDAFGRQTFPYGDDQIAMRDIIAETRNGIYKHDSFYGDGTPILKMFNIGRFDNGLVLDRLDRVRLTPGEIGKSSLRPGDILVNRVNSRELVGKAALIGARSEGWVYESKNLRLSLKRDLADPDYVSTWLNSAGARRQIEDRLKQIVGMATVSRADMDALVIPLPTVPEQRSRMILYRRHQDSLTRVRAAAAAQLAAIDALPSALLSAAFRGDL